MRSYKQWKTRIWTQSVTWGWLTPPPKTTAGNKPLQPQEITTLHFHLKRLSLHFSESGNKTLYISRRCKRSPFRENGFFLWFNEKVGYVHRKLWLAQWWSARFPFLGPQVQNRTKSIHFVWEKAPSSASIGHWSIGHWFSKLTFSEEQSASATFIHTHPIHLFVLRRLAQ